MIKTILLSLLALLVFMAPLCCRAELYQWTDENGVVHLSDTPPPKSAAKNRTKVFQKTKREHRENDAEQKSAFEPAEKKTEDDGKKKQETPKYNYSSARVELFTTGWCGVCKRARAFLAKLGVPYVDYDVEKDEEAAARLRKNNPRGSVPMAIINGRVLIGFSEAEYESALRR